MTEAMAPTLAVATPAMQHFYLAAARAALQMSTLKEMELVAALGNDEYRHKFRHHAQGFSATAVWTSSAEFTLNDEALECWREVPRKCLNAELGVEFLP